MDISVTIYVIDLQFSVCILNVLLEGSVSQIFDTLSYCWLSSNKC